MPVTAANAGGPPQNETNLSPSVIEVGARNEKEKNNPYVAPLSYGEVCRFTGYVIGKSPFLLMGAIYRGCAYVPKRVYQWYRHKFGLPRQMCDCIVGDDSLEALKKLGKYYGSQVLYTPFIEPGLYTPGSRASRQVFDHVKNFCQGRNVAGEADDSPFSQGDLFCRQRYSPAELALLVRYFASKQRSACGSESNEGIDHVYDNARKAYAYTYHQLSSRVGRLLRQIQDDEANSRAVQHNVLDELRALRRGNPWHFAYFKTFPKESRGDAFHDGMCKFFGNDAHSPDLGLPCRERFCDVLNRHILSIEALSASDVGWFGAHAVCAHWRHVLHRTWSDIKFYTCLPFYKIAGYYSNRYGLRNRVIEAIASQKHELFDFSYQDGRSLLGLTKEELREVKLPADQARDALWKEINARGVSPDKTPENCYNEFMQRKPHRKYCTPLEFARWVRRCMSCSAEAERIEKAIKTCYRQETEFNSWFSCTYTRDADWERYKDIKRPARYNFCRFWIRRCLGAGQLHASAPSSQERTS